MRSQRLAIRRHLCGADAVPPADCARHKSTVKRQVGHVEGRGTPAGASCSHRSGVYTPFLTSRLIILILFVDIMV